jgi:hypothetical protein
MSLRVSSEADREATVRAHDIVDGVGGDREEDVGAGEVGGMA